MKSDFQLLDYAVLNFGYNNKNPNEDSSKFDFQLKNHIHIQDDERKGTIVTRITAKSSTDSVDDQVGISMLFAAIFHAGKNSDKDAFQKMLQLNGMATIIPIIRSIIATASTTLGFGGKVILPNIDITKLDWDNEEETTASDVPPMSEN